MSNINDLFIKLRSLMPDSSIVSDSAINTWLDEINASNIHLMPTIPDGNLYDECLSLININVVNDQSVNSISTSAFNFLLKTLRYRFLTMITTWATSDNQDNIIRDPTNHTFPNIWCLY